MTGSKPVCVYKSLAQVWKVLSSNQDLPPVRSLLRLCATINLVDERSGAVSISTKRKEAVYPFIVLEGFDGTGKSTLTRFLAKKLDLKLISTPPKSFDLFIRQRNFFDTQHESIRRAYYSLGNYLAAVDVANSGQPVVMDRFWHSTAAYAAAHQVKAGESYEELDFIWPSDLLQPDLVIFLKVTEEERLRRHATRVEFTNTKEEQTLAEDKIFRENLFKFYRNVVGPPMAEVVSEREQKESEAKVLRLVLETFPSLKERLKVSA